MHLIGKSNSRTVQAPPGRRDGKIRIVLVDDYSLDSYEQNLGSLPELRIAAKFNNPRDAEDYFAQLKEEDIPDVAIIDWIFKRWEEDGVGLSRKLRASFRNLGILMITHEPSLALLHEFFDAVGTSGGRGFGVKGATDVEYPVSTIERVANGLDFIDPSWELKYKNSLKLTQLEPVDRAALEMLSRGKMYKQIGERLREIIGFELSEAAVGQHVTRLFKVFDIPERDEQGDPIDRKASLVRAYLEASV